MHELVGVVLPLKEAGDLRQVSQVKREYRVGDIMIRIQKYLAEAGIASRRQAEELIRAGRVQLNGETLTQMGTVIDPAKDQVRVDGKEVQQKEGKVYLLLNKPVGVVTTLHDPQRRKKITDLLKGVKERVYPVGRLDFNTEGLLLLTNDGELAYRLTHPRFKVDKTYVAEVRGHMEADVMTRLKKGVMLEDGLTSPAKINLLAKNSIRTLFEITIHEGRNRQVRRMCEAVGHPVKALRRVRFGPLKLEHLEPGEFRNLTVEEIKSLKKICQLD